VRVFASLLFYISNEFLKVKEKSFIFQFMVMKSKGTTAVCENGYLRVKQCQTVKKPNLYPKPLQVMLFRVLISLRLN